MQRVLERVDVEAAPPGYLMLQWVEASRSNPTDDDARAWLGAALDRAGHFADSHPTLRQRLAPLLRAGDPADVPPPPLAGASAAQAWLGPMADRARAEFQAGWARDIESAWRARHAEIRKLRTRYEELQAQPELVGDQRLERIRLAMRFDPRTDPREALAAFNAAVTDHSAGLYAEGCARIDHDDESGLGLLDRAMALDAEATKPVCELACTFLRRRGEAEAAESYAERWRERDAWERARQAQIDRVDAGQSLAPHGLPPEAMEAIRFRLKGEAVSHVARVYFARRIVPSDPSVVAYLMGVEVSWLGGQLRQYRAVVGRLAGLRLPANTIVVTLFEAIRGARLV